jgi:protein-S-isoprenylcysteine O-methyltransferase Ste14
MMDLSTATWLVTQAIHSRVNRNSEALVELMGMDQIRKHVPDLNSAHGRLKVGLYFLGWFLFVTCYFIVTDHIPTWSIDSQIIIITLGFLILSLFFSRKKAYQAKYGDMAYRNAFAHYGFPGLALIMSAVAHTAYMNGPTVPRGWWTILFIVLGWLLLLVGAGLWIRGIITFGFDNLALLYVYFPRDGRLINFDIYGVLRHPVYAGVLRVIIGLALLNGNANSIAFIFFAPLGLTGWIRIVEEKELIERFGQSYMEYRKHVPAFWPHAHDIGKTLHFLLKG